MHTIVDLQLYDNQCTFRQEYFDGHTLGAEDTGKTRRRVVGPWRNNGTKIIRLQAYAPRHRSLRASKRAVSITCTIGTKGDDAPQTLAQYVVVSLYRFFPNQTPEEAVAFVANLKLGRDERGDDVRKSRIKQILDLVGIPEKARKRPIGGQLAGGMTIRGLSGGERKRLALACAIAMKPKILFLDEITSGLDSENACMVISLLKDLCMSMNVAAFVVIHQVSSCVHVHGRIRHATSQHFYTFLITSLHTKCFPSLIDASCCRKGGAHTLTSSTTSHPSTMNSVGRCQRSISFPTIFSELRQS